MPSGVLPLVTVCRAVSLAVHDGEGAPVQTLYKLEGGKVKRPGIESRQPSSVEKGGGGGAPAVIDAAISSPHAFYGLWRQGCSTRDGANHCNYFGNATEQVSHLQASVSAVEFQRRRVKDPVRVYMECHAHIMHFVRGSNHTHAPGLRLPK